MNSPIMVSSPLTEEETADVRNSLIRRMYEIHAAMIDLQAEHDHLHRRLLRLATGSGRSRPVNGPLNFQRVYNMSPGNWNEENQLDMNTTRSLRTPPRSPLLNRLRAVSPESDTGSPLDLRQLNSMFANETRKLENPFLLE